MRRRREASGLQTSGDTLACPSCGVPGASTARFCPDCGLPLVIAGLEPIVEARDDRHDRARKIKPQLAEGPLVTVAYARNQTEGEFIQAMLLEEGVPSLLRRSAGYDVPDFLAAGPRDVLVPAAGAGTAREVLLQSDVPAPALDGRPGGQPSPVRLMVGLLAALALGALVVWLLSLGVR